MLPPVPTGRAVMAEFPWAVVRPMGEAVSAKGEVVPPGPMEELLAGFPVTAVRLMGEAVPAQVARVAAAAPDPMSHWRTGMGSPPALRQQLRLRQLAR